jgi:hypothetical protein
LMRCVVHPGTPVVYRHLARPARHRRRRTPIRREARHDPGSVPQERADRCRVRPAFPGVGNQVAHQRGGDRLWSCGFALLAERDQALVDVDRAQRVRAATAAGRWCRGQTPRPRPGPTRVVARDFTGDAPDQEIRHAAGTGVAPCSARARIAVFVDGCFWHSCPDHSHLPKTNTSWCRLKFGGIAAATATPNSSLRAGWPSGSGSTRIRSKRLGRSNSSCATELPRSSCAGLVCARTACPSGT